MPNAGIMASAVSITSVPVVDCKTILMEPFDNLNRWAQSGLSQTPTIVDGRTGSAAQCLGIGRLEYTIPVAVRSDYITVGLAFRTDTLGVAHAIVNFDRTGSAENSLNINSSNGLGFTRGTTNFITSAPGIFTAVNTWYYVELQYFNAAVGGWFKVRVNGTEVFSATGQNTRNNGTPDVVRLNTGGGAIHQFDDLYISTGTECVFKGSQNITACVKVLEESFDNFTNAPWAVSSTPVIVAGRTGTAAEINSISDKLIYSIPVSVQANTITVGCAVKLATNAQNQTIFRFYAASSLLTGSIVVSTSDDVFATNSAGTTFSGSSSTGGLFTRNVWHYLEVKYKLSDDPNGHVTIKLDGVQVVDAGSFDSRAGTALYEKIGLETPNGSSGGTVQYDDLYITTGSACGFRGDITVDSCTSLVEEPFNNLTAWTEMIGDPIIVTGRTGTGLQMSAGASDPSTFDSIFYTIPTINESNTLTMGFAWKVETTNERVIAQFHSEGIVHVELATNAGGGFNIRRGTPAGNVIGSSPYGVYEINTWYYLEWQVQLKNVGFARMRINGVEVINASDVDTRNGGTKTKFDRIAIGTTHSQTQTIDDLYLSSGAGCEFRGSITALEFYEPFNNLTAWIIAGSVSVSAGLTGTAATFPNGSSNGISYNISVSKQFDTIIVGAAMKFGTFVATQNVFEFRGDGGTVVHCALRTGSDGSLHVARIGGSAIGGTAPAGTITVGTWYYIEVKVKLHDTLGTAEVRVNGSTVVSGTGDTRNTSSGAVFDQFGIKSGASTTTWYVDDLYISMGPGFGFKGSIALT